MSMQRLRAFVVLGVGTALLALLVLGNLSISSARRSRDTAPSVFSGLSYRTSESSIQPVASPTPTLILSSDGLTVRDTVNKIVCLADADLAAPNRFVLPPCNAPSSAQQ